MKRNQIISVVVFLCFVFPKLYAQQIETVIQKGHSGAVKVICLSPDGKYLFTGSRDRTVKAWEVATGREIRSYKGMSKTVYALAVTPDMKYIAASGNDKDIFIWEAETGKLVRTLKDHTDRVTALAFHPEEPILISAGYDWNGRVWNFETEEIINTFKVSPDKGLGIGITINFTPDGKYIVTGADNRKANLTNYNTGEIIRSYESTEEGWCGGCGTQTHVSDNGKLLLTAAHRGPLTLWNLNSGKKQQVFLQNKQYFTSAFISSDNRKVAITDKDSLMVFNVSNGKPVFKKYAHEKDINDGAVSPDGKYFFTASDDHSVIMWSMANGKKIRSFEGYLKGGKQAGVDWDEEEFWQSHIARYYTYKTLIKLSPDGKYFLKGKIDSSARLYETETGKKVYDLQGHSKAVVCFDFSPDGKTIATGSADKMIKLWDFETGKELKTLKGHREIIFSLEFSNDGKKLLSGSWDGSARIWDTETGKELSYINLSQRSPYTARFSPNQLYALTAKLDKSLELWEIDAVNLYRNYIGHTDVVSSLDFSPDGQYMLSGSWDGRAKLWDIQTGFQMQRFDGGQYMVHDAKFSSDGKYIFTAGGKGKIIMWNAKTGEEVKRFESHPNMVSSIDIRSDNAILISCDIEGMIKIWNIATGQEILSFIPLGSKDYLVKTPKGFFDGTEKGKQAVIFVKGMKTYTLDQFFEEFYRPGLYKEAFQTLGNMQGLNINRKLKIAPPPKIVINRPEKYYITDDKSIKMEFDIEDGGGGIDEIKILHNGKRLSIDYRLPKGKKEGQTKKLTTEIQLIKGDNIIQVSAFSKERIESAYAEITVRHNTEESLPNCWMISIGINEYKNASLNLSYARSDAETFTKLIKKKGRKLFKGFKSYELIDHSASKDSILNTLRYIAENAEPEDVFIFYYAGHGAMLGDDFYFIPYDCVRVFDEESLKEDALYAGAVQELFKKTAALKQLVIMDACQSGGATELLAQRGPSEEKAIAQMSRSSGVHVLASAGSKQYATEFKQLKHGLFTYILLEALEGSADGSPEDGKVTVYEMKAYIDNLVPEYTKKYRGASQYPYTFSRGNDFPLSLE